MEAPDFQAIYNRLMPIQYTTIQTGTLQKGEQLVFTDTVPATPSYEISIVGGNSSLKVSLRDPQGRIITPNTLDSSTQYQRLEENLLPITTYIITNPTTGVWTALVEESEAGTLSDMPIAFISGIQSPIRLAPAPDFTPMAFRREAHIRVRFQNETTPMRDATIQGIVYAPDGREILIQLYDDGNHGDDQAHDGIYGSIFTPQQIGVYHATFTATAMIDTEQIQRISIWAGVVEGKKITLPLIIR